MLSQMSASLLHEWLAYSKVEPFGERRRDIRSGIISAVVANVNRKKGKKAFQANDFLPKFKRQKPQSWQEQLNIIEMLNAAFGGKEERNEDQKRWREN